MTDTTNALRALVEIAEEMELQARSGPTVDWRPNVFTFARRIRKVAALATAQPEAKGEGAAIHETGDYQSAFFWVGRILSRYGDRIGPSSHALIAERLAELSRGTRQAQDTDGKIIAALHAEVARLRRLLGGRAYEPPVSGHDPADVHTESANVDMRQAQGGGEDAVAFLDRIAHELESRNDLRDHGMVKALAASLYGHAIILRKAAARPPEDTER